MCTYSGMMHVWCVKCTPAGGAHRRPRIHIIAGGGLT